MADYSEHAAPQEPQPPASGGGAKVFLWILIGLLVLMLLGAGCCGGVIAMPFIQIWRAESMVKSQVQPLPVVQEHLGTLTKFKMNFMDTVRYGESRGKEGNWVAFDAEGEKGAATVYVHADNENNQKVMAGSLIFRDGREIDLFE